MGERIVTPEWIATQRKYYAAGVYTPDNMLHALDEVERLRAAVERVRALHGAEPDDPHWCYECNETMPCPTIYALDGEA